MNTPTLSICILAKDEAHCIRDCLESIQLIADEIIIADTGSTDDTLSIASDYTDLVYNIPWHKNFAEARNFLLSKCTKDWVLMIDCDEVLEPISKERLLSYLTPAHVSAYYINVRSPHTSETFTLVRLFRNDASYHYRNRLHEQIIQCIPYEQVVSSNLSIIHFGYTDDCIASKHKHQRNMDILSTYLPEEQDCFFYYCVGNQYLTVRNLEYAIKSYIAALQRFNDPYGFSTSLILNLEQAYFFQGLYDQVINLHHSFQHFMKTSPEFETLYQNALSRLSASGPFQQK